MKKIIAFLLVAIMVLGVVACGGTADVVTTTDTQATTQGTTAGTTAGTTTGTTTVVNPGFDENDIVLTFGAISDIHLEKNSSYNTEAKFAAALNVLAQYTEDRGNLLDAVVVVGDIGEKKDNITTFKAIYESVNLPGELFFTLGNHDQEAKYSGVSLTLKDYKDVLGDLYFANEYNDFTTGSRHMVLNGSNFIVVQPECYINSNGEDEVKFSDATVAWLDAKLAEITAADPNAYVFVFVHAMIEDTCYGSDLEVNVNGGDDGSYWYTSDLTSTLEKYNQVITFSGHLHFPINDERSIMQDKFTSIGTGSVAYLAIEDGYTNVNGTVPTSAGSVSVGHLVEVDSHGNVRVTRIDFANATDMADPWVLDAPTADGAHLTKYSANRADKNNAPSMAGVTPEIAVSVIGGNRIAALSFAAGTDDNFVHHYNIKVTNTTDNTVLKDVKYLADFFYYNDLTNMAKTISLGLGTVLGGKTYVAEVTAVDSWGATSETVKVTFTVPEGFDGTLPEAFIDIEFNADGTATDKKGVATVDLIGGATIASKDVTFKGVTKPMVGIHSNASGDSGTLTFKDYTLADMDAFYNSASGFSFEVFYVNRVKGSTCGIFCATEYGGLGFAETTNSGRPAGTPGFCVYGSSKKTFYYTAGNKAASTTELTHVVCTAIYYEGNIYANIYVNGELTGTNTIPGKVWMTDSRYTSYANQLSICNDIGSVGYPTSNCTVVDVKVYNCALNPEQAKTAYNNAAALFN